jgi:hypothetical protein
MGVSFLGFDVINVRVPRCALKPLSLSVDLSVN